MSLLQNAIQEGILQGQAKSQRCADEREAHIVGLVNGIKSWVYDSVRSASARGDRFFNLYPGSTQEEDWVEAFRRIEGFSTMVGQRYCWKAETQIRNIRVSW